MKQVIPYLRQKWNIINDHSNANYAVENEIISSIEVLNPNICDYNTFICECNAHKSCLYLERNYMTITGGNQTTEVAFKNCVPFLSVSQKFMEQQ